MKIKYFWKPILWLSLICYGLFIPAGNLPIKPLFRIPHFDKMVHFALFFGLCILLIRPFKKLKTKYYLLAFSISIALGASLEWVQHIVSHSRSSNLYDFLANALGITFALIFYSLFVSGKKWEVLF